MKKEFADFCALNSFSDAHLGFEGLDGNKTKKGRSLILLPLSYGDEKCI